ncbi:MAG TPA: hypothetical protein VKZ95_03685 [Sphingobacteriaceae bacterium]|nr:hypothetical protein [Sphingobacteriaceae bacterium]
MRNNFRDLIRQELLTRFEDVIKEEIRHHNLEIQKTNKDIAFIKKLYEDQQVYIKKIHDEYMKKYDLTKKDFFNAVSETSDIHEQQSKFIKEKEKSYIALKKEFEEKKENYISKEDFNEKISTLENEVMTLSKTLQNQIKETQNITQELYILNEKKINSKTKIVENEISEIKKFYTTLLSFVESIDSHIKSMERKKSIQEKNYFVIEKKIENLYTLIDRNKNGGK